MKLEDLATVSSGIEWVIFGIFAVLSGHGR